MHFLTYILSNLMMAWSGWNPIMSGRAPVCVCTRMCDNGSASYIWLWFLSGPELALLLVISTPAHMEPNWCLIQWCIHLTVRDWTVSPKTLIFQPLLTQNVILLGNKVVIDVLSWDKIIMEKVMWGWRHGLEREGGYRREIFYPLFTSQMATHSGQG